MKRLLSTLLSVALILTIFTLSFATTTLNEVKGLKSNVDKKINDINEKKKEQQQILKSAEEDKNKLINEQNKVGTIKEKLQDEKEKQEIELKSLEDTIIDAEKDYEAALEAFKARARTVYINSNKSYLDILLNSENLVELTSKVFILNNIAKRDREIVQNLKTTKKDLDYKKKVSQMEMAKTKAEIDKTSNQLNAILSNQTSIGSKIQDINDKIKKMEREEDALLQESKNLENKIKLFAKSGRKYIGGKMLWPTPSSTNITSYYGTRFHPVLKYNRTHTGLDIGAGMGASVLAANEGTVRLAGWQGGYGNTVIIDHGGGITSLYGHLSAILVKEDQKVKSGVQIARVGSTGISTGPHLHFEVRVNGVTQDPLNYLGK